MAERTNNFIRKLDIKEVGLIKRGWPLNMLLSISLNSKVDIFESENLRLLRLAILKVAQSEEIMRLRIVKINENEYFYERIDLEKYNFENVKFLRVSEIYKTTVEENQQVSNFLFDHMAFYHINPDEDDTIPVWRLYFFEVDRPQKLYRVFAQFHHAVVQGNKTSRIVFKIMRTYQMILEKKPVQLMESKLFPGCEKMFNLAEKYHSIPELDPVKRPLFINPNQARKNALSKPIPKGFDPNAEVVCVDTNKRFESIENLIQSSRKNHTREKIWILSKFTKSVFY